MLKTLPWTTTLCEWLKYGVIVDDWKAVVLICTQSGVPAPAISIWQLVICNRPPAVYNVMCASAINPFIDTNSRPGYESAIDCVLTDLESAHGCVRLGRAEADKALVVVILTKDRVELEQEKSVGEHEVLQFMRRQHKCTESPQ